MTTPTETPRAPAVRIRDLHVGFTAEDTVLPAVRGVDLDVFGGEMLGIVGESGSGKSVTAMSVLGLHSYNPAAAVTGSVEYGDVNLLDLPEREFNRIRGTKISMIFQDPLTALNPIMTIGGQLTKAISAHDTSISRRARRARCVELLRMVEMPDAERQVRRYPHQFSGGMRQRVMIALALANDPEVIIADEPTTALDVTIQAQVIALLEKARSETGASVVLITHDLGLVAQSCERVAVMYAGRVVEEGRRETVFTRPEHPYTAGLLESLPRVDAPQRRMPVIEGSAAGPLDQPDGCPFHPRCAVRLEPMCVEHAPALEVSTSGHRAACHRRSEMPEIFAQEQRRSTSGDAGKGDSSCAQTR